MRFFSIATNACYHELGWILKFENSIKTPWDDLKTGDKIFFKILTVPSERHFGPFEVIDPKLGRIQIPYNTKINVNKKAVQPFKINV